MKRCSPMTGAVMMTCTLDAHRRCLHLQVMNSMPSLLKYEVKAAQAVRWVVDGHADVDNAQQMTRIHCQPWCTHAQGRSYHTLLTTAWPGRPSGYATSQPAA